MTQCSGICGGLTELGRYGRVVLDGTRGDWWATVDSDDLGTHQGRGSTCEEALDHLWTLLRLAPGYRERKNDAGN